MVRAISASDVFATETIVFSSPEGSSKIARLSSRLNIIKGNNINILGFCCGTVDKWFESKYMRFLSNYFPPLTVLNKSVEFFRTNVLIISF